MLIVFSCLLLVGASVAGVVLALRLRNKRPGANGLVASLDSPCSGESPAVDVEVMADRVFARQAGATAPKADMRPRTMVQSDLFETPRAAPSSSLLV